MGAVSQSIAWAAVSFGARALHIDRPSACTITGNAMKGGIGLIVAEMKSSGATVRFHDEYCQEETGDTLTRINGIVSRAYRRRMEGAAPENPSQEKTSH